MIVHKVYSQFTLLLLFLFLSSLFHDTSAQAVYLINSGGQELNTSKGIFSADKYYSSGSATFSTTNSITGTTDDALYQKERHGNETFNYALPINNGNYKVVLHFAEIYFTAAGKRVFDVFLEGKRVLDNYDIVKKVGAYVATTETFDVSITDGTLNLNFSSLTNDGGINNPKVSAIEVLATQSSTAPLINGYTLVNAGNEQDIQPLANGDTLNLATLPSKSLNIRVNTSNAKSVRFALSGVQNTTLTESTAPYALFGDNNGDYNTWTPANGSYTLVTTPYAASGATGTVGTTSKISFTVTNINQIVDDAPQSASVLGSLKKWQPLTINFTGPSSSQSSVSPNPFLEYRLQVKFTHPATGKTFNVPGFFDGDGRGGASGSVWRVRFSPDEAGTWNYSVSFRKGTNVSIDLNPNAGTPFSFDGAKGSINITAADQNAPGFLKKGRLNYTNQFYLKFQDNSYYIKGGTNSPENFLALSFSNHTKDWKSGDPDWNNGQGKGIIGSLNYLGSMNVNSIYFLPMNIGGDAKDTWPFAGTINRAGSTTNDNQHYDINKLTNWEKIFDHAQKKGIMLHFVLNEAEAANKKELDNATLGVERKLFYRELVARFGHHNALQWNLSEEFDYQYSVSPDMIRSWAQYLQDLDPYNHPITVHNYADPNKVWAPFIGDGRISSTSFQYIGSVAGYGSQVEGWRNKTSAAGRPLPVYLDEPRSTSTSNMVAQRKELLWPTYLSGGAGLEYYVGGQDQSLQDFRTYESIWKWTWFARKFMQENLPFQQMQPADGLLTNESSDFGGGQVFAKSGQVYAIYLPNASKGGTLNLGGISGRFELKWYNPRSGLFEGAVRTITAGNNVALGLPPSSTSDDWVILLKTTTTTQRVSSESFIAKNELKSQASLTQLFRATAAPNPTDNYFAVTTKSADNAPIQIKVLDLTGRIVESKTGLTANCTHYLGQNYLPGVYYVEVLQGQQKVVLQLLKQIK